MIKILLADNHRVVRDGLGVLLETQADMCVVGAVENGREAITHALQLKPDVVVMDIAMPQLDGIEATHHIHDVQPEIKVLVLSMHSSTEHIFRALQAGAIGYLLKDAAGVELIDAVRAVHVGRRYLSRQIATDIIDNYISDRERESPLAILNRREWQILQLVVDGRSNEETARLLFLSRASVETYRSRMMRKLGLSDLPSLVKLAIRCGVAQPD